jgi:hypothetical protein
VVYAWGTAGRLTQGWVRVQGAIVGDELRLALANGARVVYRMSRAHTLDATYTLGGRITRGTFQRLKE